MAHHLCHLISVFTVSDRGCAVDVIPLRYCSGGFLGSCTRADHIESYLGYGCGRGEREGVQGIP